MLSFAYSMIREASVKLQAQPRGLALGSEGTAFVSEINAIEAFRQNQRVAHLELSYEADGIATTGEIVAVGGNVSIFLLLRFSLTIRENGVATSNLTVFDFIRITRSICMHGTDPS